MRWQMSSAIGLATALRCPAADEKSLFHLSHEEVFTTEDLARQGGNQQKEENSPQRR
jgi:hypothetical protein